MDEKRVHGEQKPCAHCGRPIVLPKHARKRWVHVSNGHSRCQRFGPATTEAKPKKHWYERPTEATA